MRGHKKAHLSPHTERPIALPLNQLLHLPKGNKIFVFTYATEAHLDDLLTKGGGLKTKSEARALCVCVTEHLVHLWRVETVSMFH